MSELGSNNKVAGGADEAAAWHVRLHSDAARESDFAAFAAWVSAPENREAYERIERLWAEIDRHSSTIAAALSRPEAPPSDATGRRSGLSSSRRVWMISGFAAAAAAAAAVVFVGAQPPAEPSWQSYRTEKFETRQVLLADGSRLHMNRSTSIRAAVGGRVRRLILDGEASFDIAHDANRPFEIEVGDQRIRVLGTEFNVLYSDGMTTVTVRRGVVELALNERPAAPTRLTAGEQSRHELGTSLVSVRRVDADAAFAWQGGRLIYQDAALGQVVADLNRYFDPPIRIEDPSLTSLRFSGVLDLDAEVRVVERLEAFLPLAATRTEHEVVLRRRQP